MFSRGRIGPNKKRDLSQLERALSQFWKSGTSDAFYQSYANDRFELFLKLHAYIIDDLAQLMGRSKAAYSRLVELGCGDGQVLNYCSQRLPELSEHVGLDINISAIELATREYGRAGTDIRFVHAGAVDWLSEHPRPGTVILTNGGVLEYFAPPSVAKLFDLVARSEPSAVVLIEPLSPTHDLERDEGPEVFGRENSFSHNYPSLLRDAGFEVVHQKDFRDADIRWIVILATTNPEGTAGAMHPPQS